MTGRNTTNQTVCRVCGKDIPAERDTTGPFCSERCRLNDLSKWFGENYRVPSSEPQSLDEDGEDAEG
jgi:endogenous inhibitor of DNA gyrase (YacG/DUF329 family)